MKKSLCLLLALVLVLTILPVSGRAAGYLESGMKGIPKLSKQEIGSLFSQDFTSQDYFVEVPSTEAPYTTGELTQDVRQKALNLLNAMRQLGGLQPVKLDPALNDLSQYGAVINAANHVLTHYPVKPADMDEAFYRKAMESTTQSNIAFMAGGDGGNPLAKSVAMYMEDSDMSNVARLGHRRWQLSAGMEKTGFGAAVCTENHGGFNLTAYYTTEYSFDNSRQDIPDFDFISWPASGNFPVQYFGKDYAWSVTLNMAKYQAPVMEDLTVTLQGGGKTWTLSGKETYTPADSGLFMSADYEGYGTESNCIIFRPDEVEAYDGVYTVTIDGIRDREDNPVEFAYQVDFFDLDRIPEDPDPTDPDPTDPEKPKTPFTDVNENAYYYNAVLWAVSEGITAGKTKTEFVPGDDCTRAQVVKFLWNAAGRPKAANRTNPFTDVSPDSYYYEAVLWAVENRITSGISKTEFAPGKACSRAQVVSFLWSANKRPEPIETQNPFDDVSQGSYYYRAVLWAVENGITSGVEKTEFGPGETCTRAQVVKFLWNNAGRPAI